METKEIFEILMRENASMLLTYIRSIAGSENAIDDIFQETMITAWKKLEDFDRSRAFGPWLRGIAKNHALNYFRKSKRDMLMCNDAILDYIEQQFNHIDTHDADSWRDRAKALYQCIDDLPEIYRHTIYLRYLEELNTAEAKKYLDIPKETFKKRLQRAKKSLLSCLRDKGVILAATGSAS